MIPSKEIRAELKKGGFARKNRFFVEIPIPDKVVEALNKAGVKYDNRSLSLRCYSTQMPPKSIATTETKIGGQNFKIPYGKIFDDITMNFIIDKKFDVKRIFDIWQDTISPNKATHVAYFDDIVTDLTIHHLNQRDDVDYSLFVKKAYPLLINSIEYSNEDENTFHLLSISWSFKTISYDFDTDVTGSQPVLQSKPTQSLEGLNVSYTLEFLDDLASFSLQGEALTWYQKVDNFVRQFTGGYNINSMATLIKRVEYSVKNNARFLTSDRANIGTAISDLKSKLGI